jgi:hypothetical protein
MRVEVHLYTQSYPVCYEGVRNCYTKGALYCVMMDGGDVVHKFPLEHIFRVKEDKS